MTTLTEGERPIIGQTSNTKSLALAQAAACAAIFEAFKARECYRNHKTPETHGAWLAAETAKTKAYAALEVVRAEIKEAQA